MINENFLLELKRRTKSKIYNYGYEEPQRLVFLDFVFENGFDNSKIDILNAYCKEYFSIAFEFSIWKATTNKNNEIVVSYMVFLQ